MQTTPRSAGAAPPGTDPLALRLITAAVLAGLIVTAVTAALTGASGPPSSASAPAGGPGAAGPAAGRTASAMSSQADGMKLLHAAAAACRYVAYQGVEVLASWGPRGTTTSVLDVWHQRGGQTLAREASQAPGRPPAAVGTAVRGAGGGAAAVREPGGPAGLDGNGVLGVDARLVSLIGDNYSLAVTGHGEVVGRPARIVTVRRGNGSIAARFWLDSVTSLPLRRQMFDARARLVSDVAFVRLALARSALSGVPVPGARAWGDKLASAQLAQLRAHGWPLPGPMPAKLTLLSAEEAGTASGPVVDLDYSDGLSVVSIFVQRGHLPADLSGWSRIAIDGHSVYASDPDDLSVTWSARGFVYTVIAAAPEQTLGEVVSALPHDGDIGFLGRIRRGLRRMFSWVSP